jgi:thioredoxin 1
MPTDPELETMRPAADWDPTAHEDVVAELADDDLTFRVWGGDWCPDCRERLPEFAAALDAADVSDDAVHVYPVENGDDGKTGPEMDSYDVERIPTVIVERGGAELARFVESAPLPVATTLVRELTGEEQGID